MENLTLDYLVELNGNQLNSIVGGGVIYDVFYNIGRGTRAILDWAGTQTLHHSGEAPNVHL